MSLVVYADESGTHDPTGNSQGADVAGIFAYVASQSQWEELSRQWQAILDEFGVEVFHASEFADRKNGPNKPSWPYRDWNDARRDDFIDRLITLARDGTYFSIGGILDVRAYDSLSPLKLKEQTKHPYHFCFQLVFDQLIFLLENHVDPPLLLGERVDSFFDQQSEWSAQATENYKTIKRLRDQHNRLGALAFVDKKDYIPLQAADLLAYVMRQSSSRKISKDDWRIKVNGWENKLKSRKNAYMGFYTEENLKYFLMRIGEKMETNPKSELDKFNTTLRKVLSVSREELQRREKEWKRIQARKKRANTSPAARASTAKG